MIKQFSNIKNTGVYFTIILFFSITYVSILNAKLKTPCSQQELQEILSKKGIYAQKRAQLYLQYKIDSLMESANSDIESIERIEEAHDMYKFILDFITLSLDIKDLKKFDFFYSSKKIEGVIHELIKKPSTSAATIKVINPFLDKIPTLSVSIFTSAIIINNINKKYPSLPFLQNSGLILLANSLLDDSTTDKVKKFLDNTYSKFFIKLIADILKKIPSDKFQLTSSESFLKRLSQAGKTFKEIKSPEKFIIDILKIGVDLAYAGVSSYISSNGKSELVAFEFLDYVYLHYAGGINKLSKDLNCPGYELDRLFKAFLNEKSSWAGTFKSKYGSHSTSFWESLWNYVCGDEFDEEYAIFFIEETIAYNYFLSFDISFYEYYDTITISINPLISYNYTVEPFELKLSNDHFSINEIIASEYKPSSFNDSYEFKFSDVPPGINNLSGEYIIKNRFTNRKYERKLYHKIKYHCDQIIGIENSQISKISYSSNEEDLLISLKLPEIKCKCNHNDELYPIKFDNLYSYYSDLEIVTYDYNVVESFAGDDGVLNPDTFRDEEVYKYERPFLNSRIDTYLVDRKENHLVEFKLPIQNKASIANQSGIVSKLIMKVNANNNLLFRNRNEIVAFFVKDIKYEDLSYEYSHETLEIHLSDHEKANFDYKKNKFYAEKGEIVYLTANVLGDFDKSEYAHFIETAKNKNTNIRIYVYLDQSDNEENESYYPMDINAQLTDNHRILFSIPKTGRYIIVDLVCVDENDEYIDVASFLFQKIISINDTELIINNSSSAQQIIQSEITDDQSGENNFLNNCENMRLSLIDNIPDINSPIDIYTSNGYIYVFNETTFYILDHITSEIPKIIGSMQMQGEKILTYWNIAYITQANVVNIIDITNKLSPKKVNTITIDELTSINDFQVNNGVMYVCGNIASKDDNEIIRFDISNPSSFIKLDSIEIYNLRYNNIMEFEILNNYLYVFYRMTESLFLRNTCNVKIYNLNDSLIERNDYIVPYSKDIQVFNEYAFSLSTHNLNSIYRSKLFQYDSIQSFTYTYLYFNEENFPTCYNLNGDFIIIGWHDKKIDILNLNLQGLFHERIKILPINDIPKKILSTKDYIYVLTESTLQIVKIGCTEELNLSYISETGSDNSYHTKLFTKIWKFKANDDIQSLNIRKVNKLLHTDSFTCNEVYDIKKDDIFQIKCDVMPTHSSPSNKSIELFIEGYNDNQLKIINIDNLRNDTIFIKYKTNLKPELSPLQIDSISAYVGQKIVHKVFVDDFENDPLSYSSSMGTIDESGNLSVTFDEPGIHTITIDVSDGIDTSKFSIDAVVTDGGEISNFFSDIPYQNTENDIYNITNYLALNGIVIGFKHENSSSRLFKPLQIVSQAEALKMLIKPAIRRKKITSEFTDQELLNLIKSDPKNNVYYNYSWVKPYLLKAFELGAIENPIYFQPSIPATKEWIAYIISNMFQLSIPIEEDYESLVSSINDRASFSSDNYFFSAIACIFFGYIDHSSDNFNPKTELTRGDLAIISSKIYRSPSADTIEFEGITYNEEYETYEVNIGDCFTIKEITNVISKKMLVSNEIIKEEWLDHPNSWVKLKIFVDGEGFIEEKSVEELKKSPVQICTTDLSIINQSQRICITILLEDVYSGVKHAIQKEIDLIFKDSDFDGIKDNEDQFPFIAMYSKDDNQNNIPDILDEKYYLSEYNYSQTIIEYNGLKYNINDILKNGKIEKSMSITPSLSKIIKIFQIITGIQNGNYYYGLDMNNDKTIHLDDLIIMMSLLSISDSN